jgi:alkanesulfonate monooxygenase SsuD/methylene tetrahydromethanopterin reductase-like flavin-dependent oxidoreductase (luciferase family)
VRLSLGLAGSLPTAAVTELARAAEDAGLDALWLNDTPDGDALAGLAAAASVTDRLRLATGVVPLDRWAPRTLVARIDELGLPHDRLVLGVGAGGAAHPLPLMADGLGDLEALGDVPVVLGALGPKMRALAAERAHGVLLSWLTPATAAAARDELRATAVAVPRTVPRAIVYARTIAEPAALPELERESARYAGLPSYAANLRRVGHSALDATIRGVDEASLAAGIADYADAVDELVLRAITADGSVAAVRRLVDAAAVAR